MVDWKKEVKFSDLLGGKKNDAPAEAAPAEEPKAEQTSVWKKEISFGRNKEPKQPKQPKQRAPKTDETPIWKKEISFRRKAKEPVDAEPEPPADSTLEPDAPAAVELVQAYVQAPSEQPAAQPPVRDSGPVEGVWGNREVPPADAESAVPVAPAVEPVAAAAPLEEPASPFPFVVPDPEPEPEPQPAAEVVDLLASAPAPVEPTAVAPAPAQPAPREPVLAPQPVAAAPSPVVVHPPVPAAQVPPLDDEEPPKKRKKKEKKEKPQGERVPFYRREFSLGKKKAKDAAAVEAEKPEKPAKTEKAEKAEKPKRERRSLSLPRPAARGGGGGRARAGKLPKRLVGLKIGASQLAAATISNDGEAEVVQVARQRLDPGIVTNGELREPDLLAEALKDFFRANKLPRRGVRLGIATNRIGVRTLEIGGIEDPKQLANAIKFRAQEALPIPIDEAVLDYQILSEAKNDEGETVRRILLVLAYRDLIDRYVLACRKAGIQLVGIDLEAFALLRALAAPREEATPAQAALVAVTVGHERTTFAVSDGRVCEFTRVLDWGGHTLNVAIARALDLAPSEVDDLKRELSLDGTEVPEGLTEEQAQKVREALVRQVQSFARELVSSLQFYQNQPGSLGIGEIVLTGGTAHLAGFPEELQRLIGVRVRLGDPLVRVKVAKKLKEPEQIGSLAVAIGLGIED